MSDKTNSDSSSSFLPPVNDDDLPKHTPEAIARAYHKVAAEGYTQAMRERKIPAQDINERIAKALEYKLKKQEEELIKKEQQMQSRR